MIEYGGTQKVMFSLASYLKSKGSNVVIVTMYSSETMIQLFQKKYGVSIYNLRMKDSLIDSYNIFKIIRGCIRLYRIIRSKNINVIQTFGIYSNIIGIPIAYISKVDHRLGSHRNPPYIYSKHIRLLDKIICKSRLTSKLLCVSNEIKNYCINKQSIDINKVLLIPNGVEINNNKLSVNEIQKLKAELQISSKQTIITTVARFTEQKNYIMYIDVIKSISNMIPNILFLFVGNGRLQTKIKEQIDLLDLSNSILIINNCYDVRKILLISDIFVLPSKWEGMSNALLEAMSVGLPTISFDICPNKELIIDNETGVLAESFDSNSLEEKLYTLLNDSKLREKIRNNSMSFIKKSYSDKIIFSTYYKLYLSLFD